MASRKVLAGCAGIGALTVALVLVAGALAFARLTATVSIPDVASFMGEEPRGFAVLSLHADDPWIAALIHRIDEKRRHRADLFPLEIAWVSFRAPDGSDGQALRLAVSPRGRLIASLVDLALWHAGHSGDANVSRTEHSGEGITAFPGSPLPGSVFVRDTSIVWAPTPASARRAVDALAAPAGPSALALLELAPDAPAAILRGALRNVDGSMARTLRSIPGGAFDLEDKLTDSVTDISFRFQAASPDEGTGHIEIHFGPGTSAVVMRGVSEDLARWLAGFSTTKLNLEPSVLIEGERSTIRVNATGLLSLHPLVLSAPERLREEFRRYEMGQTDEDA